MPLSIFNTASQTQESFEPRQAGKVSMYVCGPTVYDVPHLGHGRTALTYDTIRRYLTWAGYEVELASNVTDIDDKIIARARADNQSEPEVAQRFTRAYDDEIDRLGVLAPSSRPHATQFVDQMVEVIAELVECGAAYAVEGRGVYMSVEDVDGYGSLARRDIEQLRQDAGSRVEVDPHKKSPLDFALWKAAAEGEPTWDTPWGPGRPGWHTECVAMSLAALGEGFDIHGGGEDLVFPHHQNEWAQVRALGKDFARYWVHSALVNVEGKKMAKSVGNFTNLGEAIDAVGARAVRMAALQTHYRKPMEMGQSSLGAAAVAVERLDAFARRLEPFRVAVGASPAELSEPGAAEVMRGFVEAMEDDFSTPSAMDVGFRALRRANATLDDGTAPQNSSELAGLCFAVFTIFSVLGIEPAAAAQAQGDLAADSEIDRLLTQREKARAEKDFARADQIRDELYEMGIVIEDTAGGASWRRK